MSDKAPETPGSPSKPDNDRTERAHYYDDGNITLSLKGTVLFKVHKSILALHSQTFKDMFSLPNIPPATEKPDDPVVLDDDPDTFQKLLDCMYKGIDFTQDATPQDHLGVLRLARKYEMDAIETHMKRRLKSKLPSSAEVALLEPEAFQPYDNDPLLARAVLDSGIEELTSWAFYSLGVHVISAIDTNDKSMYGSPSILSTLDHTYIFPLLIFQQVINDTFTKWQKRISEFYRNGCTSTSSSTSVASASRTGFGAIRSPSPPRTKNVTPQCLRGSMSFNQNSPLDLSTAAKQVDPVKLMVPRMKDLANKMENQSSDYHRKWCTECIKSLKEIASVIVLELYPHLVECAARLDCHVHHNDAAAPPSN